MKQFPLARALAFVLSITAGASALVAHADPTQEILRVTSDNKDSLGQTFRLDVASSGGAATQLIYHTYKRGTSIAEDDVFDVQTVIKNGATLVKMDDFEVVRILAPTLNPRTGGQVIMDYLNNGATGKRAQFYLWFQKDNAGAWEVLYNGKKITDIFFKTNKVLGKEVGISQIRVVR